MFDLFQHAYINLLFIDDPEHEEKHDGLNDHKYPYINFFISQRKIGKKVRNARCTTIINIDYLLQLIFTADIIASIN